MIKASDHDAAVELVITEYQRLQRHNSGHSLLRYICNVSDEGFNYSPDEQIRQEILDAFAPGDEPVAVMLAKYYVALRKAVDEVEGIDRSPKKKETKPIEVMVEEVPPLPF